MQMKPFDFWHEYTFAEFQRKSFYFFRNRNDEFKDNWERLRQMVYVTASVNGAKASATELMPFSWDKEGRESKIKGKPMTAKEAADVLKRYGLNKN